MFAAASVDLVCAMGLPRGGRGAKGASGAKGGKGGRPDALSAALPEPPATKGNGKGTRAKAKAKADPKVRSNPKAAPKRARGGRPKIGEPDMQPTSPGDGYGTLSDSQSVNHIIFQMIARRMNQC